MTKYGTPYADDALRVESGTQPEEIREFVKRRTLNPVRVAGVEIFNYNNHVVDREQIREQADEFHKSRYLIPYQASGVWGYMVQLLPQEVLEVEILTYQQSSGKYVPYPNYVRHALGEETLLTKLALRDDLRDRGIL